MSPICASLVASLVVSTALAQSPNPEGERAIEPRAVYRTTFAAFANEDTTILGGVELRGNVEASEAYLLEGEPVLLASQTSIRERSPVSFGEHTVLPRMRVALPIEIDGYRITSVQMDVVGGRVASIQIFLSVGGDFETAFQRAIGEILLEKPDSNGEFVGNLANSTYSWRDGSRWLVIRKTENTRELCVWVACTEFYPESNRPTDPSMPSKNTVNVDQEIRAKCAAEWTDDYSMQKFCVDQQEQAFNALQASPPTDVPTGVFGRVRAKCEAEWPDDYKMRKFCEDQQLEAWHELNR